MEQEEQAFSFDSAFRYDTGEDFSKYRTDANHYNSTFSYSENPDSKNNQASSVAFNEEKFVSDIENAKISHLMMITIWVLTFLSYVFFAITSPITYFICVKKLGEFDRFVVFRLGKMIGVKGPGRVIIFPWMDKTKKIDVRAPPSQWDGQFKHLNN